jgi:steroid delta-isomerase-like uncharacterized protein
MNDTSENGLASLEITSAYVTALAARDSEGMDALCAPDFRMDMVHGDAFEQEEMSHQGAREFWPAWFSSFPVMDYQVTRTIAAESVVVTQWVFLGTNSGPLTTPVFDRDMEPTGRTIRFRGVSIYDVDEGLIQRETVYLDLATIFVELGVSV